MPLSRARINDDDDLNQVAGPAPRRYFALTLGKFSTADFFGQNAEQEIAKNVGLFARLNYNDGQNETWAFTEIDHRAYLAAGGCGFMVGDGPLNYGLEQMGEVYYSLEAV